MYTAEYQEKDYSARERMKTRPAPRPNTKKGRYQFSTLAEEGLGEPPQPPGRAELKEEARWLLQHYGGEEKGTEKKT